MNAKQFQDAWCELQRDFEAQRSNDRQTHEVRLAKLQEENDARIREFDDSTNLQVEKDTNQLQEQILLRQSLNELQATNQKYVPRYIEHLMHWEAYYRNLRKELAHDDINLEPPSPLE